MRNDVRYMVAAASFACALAAAPTAGAAGKIVCWKDASGKTIGCGDTVPPEYRGSATKELDKRGVTRRTTESAEEAAKRREREQEEARLKAEEEKRLAEQQRQDLALLSTFSNAAEIDAKRDRDLQTIDLQIVQQRTLQTSAAKRHRDLQARKAQLEKTKQPVPATLADDIARAEEEKRDLEASIAAKEREKVELRRKYGEMKARYTQLRGGTAKR
jgi:hypothetical protein